MECNKSSSGRGLGLGLGLRRRLSLLFHPTKSLLLSSCNSTSTSNITSTPSRRSLLSDSVIEPTFIPKRPSLSCTTCQPLPFPTKKEIIKNPKPPPSKKPDKATKPFSLSRNAYGFTTSSSLFTSEEEEEDTEDSYMDYFNRSNARSFSSDSSNFYRNCKNSTRRRCHRRRKRTGMCREVGPGAGSPGFAVVKSSKEPYGDFRDSMVEMIVERQIFGAEELEKLLQMYLSLNSPRHRPVILQAFSDIWVVLFGH